MIYKIEFSSETRRLVRFGWFEIAVGLGGGVMAVVIGLIANRLGIQDTTPLIFGGVAAVDSLVIGVRGWRNVDHATRMATTQIPRDQLRDLLK